jgi:hypothetical protein
MLGASSREHMLQCNGRTQPRSAAGQELAFKGLGDVLYAPNPEEAKWDQPFLFRADCVAKVLLSWRARASAERDSR